MRTMWACAPLALWNLKRICGVFLDEPRQTPDNRFDQHFVLSARRGQKGIPEVDPRRELRAHPLFISDPTNKMSEWNHFQIPLTRPLLHELTDSRIAPTSPSPWDDVF